MVTSMNVVLLGTGSPRPCAERAQPAQLIELGGESFLVDCGDAVTLQLARSGRDITKVQKVFLTHLHWDHILGYAGLVWGGWSAGRPTLEVWGPPGTKAMHELLFRNLHAKDVEWISNVGYARSGIDSIKIHEVGEGQVYARDGITVTAARVKHTVRTYAYRFSYLARSVVFSGDTAQCSELVGVSTGADVLIQDTCAVFSRLYGDERSRKIRDALIGFHASPEQAGEMAQQAGVKTLVCTHLLPGVDAQQVLEEAGTCYNGNIVVGEDLMEVKA